MVEKGVIAKDTARSYYLEGLIYNVPNNKFGISSRYTDTFAECVNWILSANRNPFVCANEQYYLLRNTEVTWSPEKGEFFLKELKKYWDSWGS
jgi:hypothetical protein